jgi:hypothetical protein
MQATLAIKKKAADIFTDRHRRLISRRGSREESILVEIAPSVTDHASLTIDETTVAIDRS